MSKNKCKVCGKSAKLQKGPNGFYVRCKDFECFCQNDEQYKSGLRLAATREQAVQDWNRHNTR